MTWGLPLINTSAIRPCRLTVIFLSRYIMSNQPHRAMSVPSRVSLHHHRHASTIDRRSRTAKSPYTFGGFINPGIFTIVLSFHSRSPPTLWWKSACSEDQSRNFPYRCIWSLEQHSDNTCTWFDEARFIVSLNLQIDAWLRLITQHW